MREAAGLLSANLGEAMDRTGKHTTDPSVQEAFFRHSVRTFPENPVAFRSLGYKFEQSGQELRAMELYREGFARNPERLDLRLLLASSCSPFLDDTPHQGDMRQVTREGKGRCSFTQRRTGIYFFKHQLIANSVGKQPIRGIYLSQAV